MPSYPRLYALPLVVLLVSPAGAAAQDRQVRFHDSGFTSPRVTEDSTGFLWFTSGNSVIRYDGRRSVEYVHDPGDDTTPPRDVVESVIASRQGGVWLGTLGSGVARFVPESETFERFLPGVEITDLLEVRDGTLWAAGGGDLFHLDPATGAVDSFRTDAEWVYALHEDREGDLWVGVSTHLGGGTDGALLFRKPAGADSLIGYLTPGSADQERLGVPEYGVPLIVEEPDGRLLFGALGVLAYDRPADSLYRPAEFDTPGLGTPLFMHRDSRGWMWISDEGALYRYSGAEGDPQVSFRGSVFQAVAEDRDGIIWLGSYRGSVVRVEPETGEYEFWRFAPGDADGPPEGAVQHLYRDRSGAIWVEGSHSFEPTGPTFRGVVSDPDDEEGFNARNITAVHRAPDGSLWIGTNGQGVFRRDPETGAYTTYGQGPPGEGGLTTAWIAALASGPDGSVWVGTNGGGVNRIRPGGRIDAWLPSGAGMEGVRGVVTDFEVLPNGDVLALDVDQLIRIDAETGRVDRLYDRIRDGDPTFDGIGFHLAVEPDGAIWVGTQDTGLFHISADGTRSHLFYHRTEAPSALGTNTITSLLRASDGTLWAGTLRGLVRIRGLEGDSLLVDSYGEAVGLEAAVYTNLLEDETGRLWMTRGKDVFMVHPADGSWRAFGAGVDLPGFAGSFWNGAADRDTLQGLIHFGGQGGVVSFAPDEVLVTAAAPTVVVSAGRRYDSADEAGTPIRIPGVWAREEVVLDHTDNIVEFDLAALSFGRSDLNRFAYRLEGFSEAWIDLGPDGTVTLTNLDAGNYTLWIRGANADGVWSADTPALRIRQLPPWWLSNVAYFVYGVLVLGGLVTTDRVQRRRVQAKERRQAELREAELRAETAAAQAREADAARRALQAENERKEVELEKARELREAFEALEAAHERLKRTQDQLVHAEKMASLGQLTAGIAHEIKNPLNFVNNFAELNAELAEELSTEVEGLEIPTEIEDLVADLVANAQQIAKHGKRADVIVASMMEHAVAASGERADADVAAQVAEYASLSYHAHQARYPGFECRLEIPEDHGPLVASVVSQELGRVWLNLFTNAYDAVADRARQAGDEFEPTVAVQVRAQEAAIEVRVSDNGTGIPDDLRGRIFEPFYTTKPTGQGNTGLGLSLTHDIVAKGHGGTIRVEDTPGGGATFVVTLPVAEEG